MWQRPFTIALGTLAAGRQHRLVVSVTKEAHSAGIWRTVGLMARPSVGTRET